VQIKSKGRPRARSALLFDDEVDEPAISSHYSSTPNVQVNPQASPDPTTKPKPFQYGTELQAGQTTTAKDKFRSDDCCDYIQDLTTEMPRAIRGPGSLLILKLSPSAA
jgi:hypothetical protein